MISFWIESSDIQNGIFIPKYYDPKIDAALSNLEDQYELTSIGSLEEEGILEAATGNEIGKEAYGTGSIPFVRTSDISNWEIKTAPKQGISEEIFGQYKEKQDVRDGDILFVRDGTYLIGTNCFVTSADKDFLYQSHILKFRPTDRAKIQPEVLFLALNCPIVQKQIRSKQFTADIIDTVGGRYKEIILPIPRDRRTCRVLAKKIRDALEVRVRGKAFVKQAPLLIESALKDGTTEKIDAFLKLRDDQLEKVLVSDTVTLEFGEFETTRVWSSEICNRIFLPKYYDPEIDDELSALSEYCRIWSIGSLVDDKLIDVQTGDEVGKLAYGTGEVPFLRTTDFANWEIKHNPKHSVSEEIYDQYTRKQNLKPLDILLVRDGTYLVGSSTIVQAGEERALYCGGLYRIRSNSAEEIDPYLLLGVLNSYIVKRQIRAKQFTRDVIDTIGKRLFEVRIPWPKDPELRKALSQDIRAIVESRAKARDEIHDLANEFASN